MQNFYLSSFSTFFKIGLFTIGGGYAMIPLIEAEIVEKKKWISKQEFVDIVAVAQSCPGVFAINTSVFIGYKMRKTPGAIFSCAGTAMPSFLIILIIALFFQQFSHLPVIAAMFRGIRPAVVALIAAPTFRMAKTCHISRYNCWIPITTAILIWLLGVSPIPIIIVAAIGGFLYGKIVNRHNNVSGK